MLNMSFSDTSRVKTFGHMHIYFMFPISQDNSCDLCLDVLSEISVWQEHLRNYCTFWNASENIVLSVIQSTKIGVFQETFMKTLAQKQTFQNGTQ